MQYECHEAWVVLFQPNTHQLKYINSPRRHEVHEEKPKQNLRALRLRVFVVKCLNLLSMRWSYSGLMLVIAEFPGNQELQN